MELLTDEGKFKELLKEALIEVIEERKDALYDLLTEVMEDIAMTRAIDENGDTTLVDRQEVFQILEGQG